MNKYIEAFMILICVFPKLTGTFGVSKFNGRKGCL